MMAGFRRWGIVCLALITALMMGAGSTTLAAQNAGGGRGPGARRGGFMMGGNGLQGSVTAVTGAKLSITDAQGQAFTVETGPNTRILKDRQETKPSDIHVGDEVVAAGHLDEQTKTLGAVFVVVLTPEQAARVKQMRADFGKTWTTGRVTARGDLKLTIERPDHVSQSIGVNENTQFSRRGPDGEEEIAFPDIKVGDRVMARGALANGSFVASRIDVMPPHINGQGRFGRRGPASQPNGAPPSNEPQN